MEEALTLNDYLPDTYKSETERDYIAFLWDAFKSNYTYGKYQFAFLSYHMLTMSFVYFNVWQIKQNRPNDFMKTTYGFTKDNEDTVMTATSPFTFSEIGESAIFRFLKLIDCDNSKIGNYTKLVKDRNACAHTNGVIRYANQQTLDAKISETLRAVAEVQDHSKCVIEECYKNFLLGSHDPEEREYADSKDQIREVLIHNNYFSKRDIGICIASDLAPMAADVSYAAMQELHKQLVSIYSTTQD